MAAETRSVPATGVVLTDSKAKALQVYGTTVPVDGTSGYATGCLFIKTNGGAGTTLYVNEGSDTSSDFNAK